MSARAAVQTAAKAAPVLTPAPAAVLQRQCECGQLTPTGECDECKKKRGVLARSAAGRFAPQPPLPPIDGVLNSRGAPLDGVTRRFMESRFHHDFSSVRVHTDDGAAASARALQARAWTLGNHVVFAPGMYSPETEAGQRLLAHELAHVVQQKNAPAHPAAALEVSEPGDAGEREAEAAATKVMEGEPVSLHSAAAPETIQRVTWEQAKPYAIGGGIAVGVAGLVALLWWLHKRDPANIENPPQCGDRQMGKIRAALEKGKQWVKTAVDKLAAFRSRPNAAESGYLRDAVKNRFASDRPEVIEKVDRVVVHIGKELERPRKSECHTKDVDDTCGFADAYVNDTEIVVLCPSFFNKNDDDAALAMVHEMSHKLVGGAHIGDRAYRGERMMGGGGEPTHLAPEEALTNAESYAEFIADLVLGKSYGGLASAPDVLDCPNDWKEPLKTALARAQRASIAVVANLSDYAEEAAKDWQDRWTAQHIAGPAPDVAYAKKIYGETMQKIPNQLHVACERDPGACSNGDFDWTLTPPQLTVCGRWKDRMPEQQAAGLLAALYGWLGGVENASWRQGLAQVAMEVLKREKYAPPKAEDVFGSASWSADQIRIAYIQQTPSTGHSYEESAAIHTRLSKDVPVYQGGGCTKSELPFKFTALFYTDQDDKPRPGPFSPLRVAVHYDLSGGPKIPRGDFKDDYTTFLGPGRPLKATVKFPIDLKLDSDGDLNVDITLSDPDTGTVREYKDTVRIDATGKCGGDGKATPASQKPNTKEVQP